MEPAAVLAADRYGVSMNEILVGTADGLRVIGERGRTFLEGRSVDALARDGSTWWAITDGRQLWRDVLGTPRPAAAPPGLRANCLLPTGASVLVGMAEARLFWLQDGQARPVASFDRVEGRDGWYTPWGGPPDVRTLSAGPDGAIYANVHVGGIPVSQDGGETWAPTIDVHADVHQVLAHPSQPGRVLAATARGFAQSRDGGSTWEFVADGLHARRGPSRRHGAPHRFHRSERSLPGRRVPPAARRRGSL
jgi:hypothetical protein